MAAYRDSTGRWRFRTRVELPCGKVERISGSSPKKDNTQRGALRAEHIEVERLINPPSIAPAKENPSTEIPTVKEYAPLFLAEQAADHKPSERRGKERILEMLYPYFGALRLDEIRQSHVQQFIAAQRRIVGRKTVDNRLAVLSSLLRYAAANEIIPRPALRFKSTPRGAGVGRDGGKVFALPMADVERLLDAATDPRYRVAILLGAEAGLRAGEIRGLQWGDIKDGVLTVRRALDNETDEVIRPKHDKSRTVPLSPRLAAALAALPRRGLWVVGRLDGDLLGYFGLHEAIVATYGRAGVPRPPKPIHSLRHTFGTVCARRGVPIATLQDLMGHESIETTRRYITTTEDDKLEAVARAFGAGQNLAKNPDRAGAASDSSSEM